MTCWKFNRESLVEQTCNLFLRILLTTSLLGIFLNKAEAEVNATIGSGWTHTLILKTDGSLWTVGRNQHGQLGDGNTTDRNESIKIVDTGVIDVAAGQQHLLFVKSDGSLWAMGDNQYGQLGDGTTTNRTTPVKIVNNDVSQVEASKPFPLS